MNIEKKESTNKEGDITMITNNNSNINKSIISDEQITSNILNYDISKNKNDISKEINKEKSNTKQIVTEDQLSIKKNQHKEIFDITVWLINESDKEQIKYNFCLKLISYF